MSTKSKAPIITARYWLVLSTVAGVVALSPLAVLLVNFAANPSSNPFDESSYGAVIWVTLQRARTARSTSSRYAPQAPQPRAPAG